MEYRVLIESKVEISTIAKLLFNKTKRGLIKGYVHFEYAETFNNRSAAKEFVKEYFSGLDKKCKEDVVIFVVFIEDNKIICIRRYDHRLKLQEEVF